ncbi:MAG: Fic family protein, partial [Nitrospinota bacterium]
MKPFEEVDALKAKLEAHRPLDPGRAAAVREKFRLEWTYHSNAIEGNTLTLSETRFMLLEGITVGKGKPLSDYIEAVDHAEAIDYLEEVIRGKKDITEGFIRELHGFLFKGQPKDKKDEVKPGKYKDRDNHVILPDGSIHFFTPHLKVPEEMGAMMRWYEEEGPGLHAIELASLLHHRFVAIHPFNDGNGRTARLLMNLILMREGYEPAIIRLEERADYFEALRQADEGNATPFILMVERAVARSLQLKLDVIEGRTVFDEKDLAKRVKSFSQRMAELERHYELSQDELNREREECIKKLGGHLKKKIDEFVRNHQSDFHFRTGNHELDAEAILMNRLYHLSPLLQIGHAGFFISALFDKEGIKKQRFPDHSDIAFHVFGTKDKVVLTS